MSPSGRWTSNPIHGSNLSCSAAPAASSVVSVRRATVTIGVSLSGQTLLAFSIGVDTSLEDLTLNLDGTLRAPTDYQKAGWYAQGTVPGDVGPAVIAGKNMTKLANVSSDDAGVSFVRYTS